MSNISNLKPWKPGQSGNPKGRPIGALSWSTVVRNLLNSEDLVTALQSKSLIINSPSAKPLNIMEAIAIAQIVKAINGDTRSAEWLRKLEQSDTASEYDDSIDTIFSQLTTEELKAIAYGHKHTKIVV